ncbi:histidine kinase [Yinghuangia seranimata]|nr:histidine kinase [Yinghuangia seranimata]MDI2125479.1 histidine kinase [Yinghuangia seranimata]
MSDVLLATAVAVPPRVGAHPEWRPVPVQIVVMAFLVLPLLARRRHPRLVAVVVAAAGLVQFAGQVWGDEIQRGNVALAAVLYTLVVRGLVRDAARLAAFAAGLTLVWAVSTYPQVDADVRVMTPGATALLFASAALLGAFNRSRREYLAEVERRARLAESEREALARAAVAEERARVAREIHDVLAHSVSVMVLNAEGAKLVRHADPAAVDRTLDIVSETGRAALHDLRVLLEVLRAPEAALGPQPGSRDIGELVARCSLGRAPIDYTTTGESDGLPASFTLQVYRVVQEGLTNLVKHAAPDAAGTVHVDFGAAHTAGRRVRIEVRNAAGTAAPAGLPSAGQGLRGLEERVAMFGGRVHAGATSDGGFALRADLPVDRAGAGNRPVAA